MFKSHSHSTKCLFRVPSTHTVLISLFDRYIHAAIYICGSASISTYPGSQHVRRHFQFQVHKCHYIFSSASSNISSSSELSLLSLASSLSFSSNSSLLLSLHDSRRQRGPHTNAFLQHLQFVPFAHLFFLQQHLTRRISFCVLRF